MEYQEIILDLMNRVLKLEKEVDLLKTYSSNPSHKGRISTGYIMSMFEPKTEGSEDQTTANFRNDTGRDRTRYLFNGNVYLKNRLVLAIVTDYVQNHPNIMLDELKQVFSKTLQGSIGVVESVNIAKTRNDYTVRFFTKEDDVLHLIDCDAYVCTQWGILNIPNFVARARQLGYYIEEV